MKAAGYIRVSTGKQTEGLGLTVQARAVRAFARSHNMRLVALFSDEGVSGAVEDRPALAEALAMLEEGKAEVLVVPKLDRLARRLTVQEAILAQVWRLGGRVFAADTGEVTHDDPEDPMRTAMRQMMGVFSQLERAMISARLSAGRRLKAERGGYAYGAPPFGMKSLDGKLVEDGAEATVVRRAVELRHDGRSLRDICSILNREGLEPRRSGSWHPMTLSRVLHRAGAA